LSVSQVDPSVVSTPVGLEGIMRLRTAFDGVPDPRQAQGIRHELVAVLVLTVMAVLAGASNYRELGDRAGEFSQPVLGMCGARFHPFLGIWEAPSSATFRRVVQTVDAAGLDRAVGTWLRERIWAARIARLHRENGTLASGTWPSGTAEDAGTMACSGYGPVEGIDGLAIDGKTVRNSGDGDLTANVRLFSALLHREKIVVAQIVVPADTTEVTCVRDLLKDQPLTGVTVTADAAHTLEDTASYLALERGGDYILMAKGNQPTLMRAIAARMPAATEGSADHIDDQIIAGQRVVREIWTAPAEGIDFPAAAQVFRIRRRVFELTGQCLSKEIVHGVTSLPAHRATAADLASFVRRHWLIESNHWLRDTDFREDHQYAHTGNSAHALAALRNLALGILRLAGVTKIRATLQQHAADHSKITRLLSQVTHPQSMIN